MIGQMVLIVGHCGRTILGKVKERLLLCNPRQWVDLRPGNYGTFSTI